MFDLKRIDLLVAAALREARGEPALEAVAKARAGLGTELFGHPPDLLVDVIRVLSILGEYVTLDAAYAAWRSTRHGIVHFEAALAALTVPDRVGAEARLERAVETGHPAWHPLAALRALRGDLSGARAAIRSGLEQQPADAAIARTAAVLAAGDPSIAELTALDLELRRFPEHAELARAAAKRVDLLRVKGLLLRRAGELEGR